MIRPLQQLEAILLIWPDRRSERTAPDSDGCVADQRIGPGQFSSKVARAEHAPFPYLRARCSQASRRSGRVGQRAPQDQEASARRSRKLTTFRVGQRFHTSHRCCLLDGTQQLGASCYADGDALQCKASKGVLTTGVIRQLKKQSIPNTAFRELEDNEILSSELDAWRQHTMSTFNVSFFPVDHFSIQNDERALLRRLFETLDHVLTVNQ